MTHIAGSNYIKMQTNDLKNTCIGAFISIIDLYNTHNIGGYGRNIQSVTYMHPYILS